MTLEVNSYSKTKTKPVYLQIDVEVGNQLFDCLYLSDNDINHNNIYAYTFFCIIQL